MTQYLAHLRPSAAAAAAPPQAIGPGSREMVLATAGPYVTVNVNRGQPMVECAATGGRELKPVASSSLESLYTLHQSTTRQSLSLVFYHSPRHPLGARLAENKLVTATQTAAETPDKIISCSSAL